MSVGAVAPTQAPSLLVFYHVPKTGGSSVREWLLRNAGVRARGLPTRLQGLVRYYESRCFLCLQLHEVLAAGCPESEALQCGKVAPRRGHGSFDSAHGDWRTAGALAVEFHGPSAGTFVEDVLPRAHALRKLYASRNGSVTLATLIREPVDFLFSSYHMWPPRPGDAGTPTAVRPFATSTGWRDERRMC